MTRTIALQIRRFPWTTRLHSTANTFRTYKTEKKSTWWSDGGSLSLETKRDKNCSAPSPVLHGPLHAARGSSVAVCAVHTCSCGGLLARTPIEPATRSHLHWGHSGSNNAARTDHVCSHSTQTSSTKIRPGPVQTQREKFLRQISLKVKWPWYSYLSSKYLL